MALAFPSRSGRFANRTITRSLRPRARSCSSSCPRSPTPPVRPDLARNDPSVVAFRLNPQRRHLEVLFSGFNHTGLQTPRLTLRPGLTVAPHSSGSRWFATPSLYETFTHDSAPVYPDARIPRPLHARRSNDSGGTKGSDSTRIAQPTDNVRSAGVRTSVIPSGRGGGGRGISCLRSAALSSAGQPRA